MSKQTHLRVALDEANELLAVAVENAKASADDIHTLRASLAEALDSLKYVSSALTTAVEQRDAAASGMVHWRDKADNYQADYLAASDDKGYWKEQAYEAVGLLREAHNAINRGHIDAFLSRLDATKGGKS